MTRNVGKPMTPTTQNRFTIFAFAAMLLAPLAMLHAAGLVTPEELLTQRNWIKGVFDSKAAMLPPAGLVVLENHDSVQRNGRGKSPLKLGAREFTRGLFR